VADYLTKRNGFWQYARRVPDEFKHLDLRGVVKLSTKIRIADDPKAIRAKKVAARLDAETEAYWRGLKDGQSVEARTRYMEARRRARSLGFDYATVPELVDRPIIDVLERFERLMAMKRPDDEQLHAAVLGGEPEPELSLSGLFERFETITAAERRNMSPDQIRKWKNPKLRAIKNLIEVIGDKTLTRITRADALDFRTWWQDRVLAGEVDVGTANKDIGHLNRMFREIERTDRLGLQPVFSELRIQGEKDASRIPYPPAFIQERILKEGALDQLNEEARCILYLMVETGMRLSEAANLTAETIVLKWKVPHVRIRPNGRELKTPQSERDIPLVGVSLMAAQRFPEGFPRYFDNAASLSALVNKVLKNAGLRPRGESLYSLRHSFEDRLTAVEAPEKLIANLMGHKYARPKYGVGHSLEQKQEWLQRIAFKPPSRV